MELFSKKIRLIPAIFCIVLTLVLSYTLYASEYKYQINKEDLSSAISDFNSLNTIDAHVLETKKHDSDLIVSFKDNPNSGVYGIAKFIKGINQKYRIVETQVQKSVFSPVIQSYKVEIKDILL